MSDMEKDDTEALLGLLHDLAELDRDELESRFNAGLFTKVQELVRRCVKGGEVPSSLDKAEFVDWVYALRSNEREWSRHLGDVILAVEEKSALGDTPSAIADMESFISGCPWLPFSEIAHVEMRRLKS